MNVILLFIENYSTLPFLGTILSAKKQGSLDYIFKSSPGHEYRRQYWRLHPHVMVRVYADLLVLLSKPKLAVFHTFQLVMGLEVRPTPHSAVDDVGKTFSVGHLGRVSLYYYQPSVGFSNNTLSTSEFHLL